MDTHGTEKADSSEESKKNSPQKEETVYIMTDSTGKKTKTIVSNWLKNPKGETDLADKSNLSDIENVKTSENYTSNGDSLTWKTNGGDIYYKGYSDESVPVTINITYKLNHYFVNIKISIRKLICTVRINIPIRNQLVC